MDFYLMTKDIEVLKFNINTISGISSMQLVTVYNDNLIPLSLRSSGSLQSWLESRLIMEYRKDVSKLFNTLGVYSLEDKLLCTHCISLLDTYWVKSEDDRLNWSTVSPYRNPFNELIARYSFYDSIIGSKNVGHSPDFSTGGSYPKCWRRLNNAIYLYKAGSSGAVNSGNEPYCEVLASELAKHLGFNSVEYELLMYKGVLATRCKNICTEDIGLYTVSEVCKNITSYSDIFKMVKDNVESVKQLVQILLLDYLTLNVDRHFDNISFLVDNKTQTLLRIAPIYDNNMSLLPYYIEKFDGSVEDYLNSNNDYKYTKIGQSFDDLLKMLYSINKSYVLATLRKASSFSYNTKIKRSGIANEVLRIQLDRSKTLLK